jgi:hypothetical protein
MAISECHYRILKHLRDNGTLPECKSILNIGQPNWYGDMSWDVVWEHLTGSDADSFAENHTPIEMAELAYRMLFDFDSFVSIDIGGDENAIKADLNYPVTPLGEWHYGDFDLVVNHGTAEHIFNIAQVFRTMHDYCKPGGFMIHEAPWTGWIDHGFYSLQPTLFYDLAAANAYELPFVGIAQVDKKRVLTVAKREAISEIVLNGGPPADSLLFVVLKKTSDEPFKIPQQGVYGGKVSETVRAAWRQLR